MPFGSPAKCSLHAIWLVNALALSGFHERAPDIGSRERLKCNRSIAHIYETYAFLADEFGLTTRIVRPLRHPIL